MQGSQQIVVNGGYTLSASASLQAPQLALPNQVMGARTVPNSSAYTLW